jgi:tRNA(adenine34) deaminase
MNIEFMKLALQEARTAYKKDEVPVGAVLVCDGKVISTGYNKREKKQNALLHAEIIAINKACKKLKSWRLENCELYVTLEPCSMCAGAIINSRIKTVYYGAYDKKAGACGSVVDLCSNKQFNHNPEVKGGIMEEECGKLLKDFFRARRKENKQKVN